MTEAAAATETPETTTPEDTATQTPADPAVTTETTEAKPEQGGNILTGEGDDKPTDTQAKQTWPDDWRAQLAGEDEKLAKKLDRFNSISDVVKWAQNLEKKMSSGEFSRKLPEDATEEDIKQWRLENGVPESPEKYDLDVDGISVGEDDKPYLDEFLKAAHELNMPNDHVKQVVKWHFDNVQAQLEERAEADTEFMHESVQALKEEWGGEYKQNINMVKGLLSSAPEGFADRLMGARLGDDKPLGSDPEALKWLAGLARQVNPVATVVPGAGGDQVGAIEDEISKIEKFMRTNRHEYFNDPKMQDRYRDLLSAKERLK
ncbi:hypothetical protein RE428_31850 [Marinobacter nanhaiticus D15-8W]|nr:hypothetical protein RE428_31850 [Marinobacter nanhaiticus D15-8W]